MTEQTPDPEPEVVEPTDPSPPPPGRDPLRRSRTSGAWTALIVAGVLLVLLIVFIAQNTDDVHISFFGWDGTAPLAVALLIATAAGVLITAVVGTLRIWQLRRRVKRAH
jgi:uncharacterized integral membrane protein